VLLRPPDLADYYPRRARLSGTTGRSTVRVTVDERGAVTGVAVVDSTPPGVFDHAATRVARTLRFRPALRDGRPTRSAVSIDMIWRMER
jgi:TonB family protein